MINGDETIGVSIKSETYIELFLKDFLLQKCRIDRPTLLINIDPIWRSMPDTYLAAKLAKQGRSHCRGCPISTVQTDTQLHRGFIVKNLLEKIDIMPSAILIEDRTSNRFSSRRSSHIYTIYVGFKLFLKPVLQLGPCGGEKLDPIIHIRVMRGGNHYASDSPYMTYQIGNSSCWENPYIKDIRPC